MHVNNQDGTSSICVCYVISISLCILNSRLFSWMLVEVDNTNLETEDLFFKTAEPAVRSKKANEFLHYFFLF